MSNDTYVDTVLPAYVQEKPLRPWYMDPETNRELASLQRAASEALHPETAGTTSRESASSPSLRFRYDKILFVLNLHRPFSEALLSNRRVLLRNNDFLVLGPGD